ncbi:Hsp70 family protein, partial [Candidatus Woesearchaeota archaeon]|nr:Hsp70 family protein [Candidatus Woesearchaeota archaeon]
MPIVQKYLEQWFGSKVERSIDPMECVAMGAAVQAGVLAGEVKDILLLDVTPLSLGIETLGGVFTKLIERNTTIPVKRSQVFSTAADNQPAVTIRISQGERPMFNDNKLLGQFDLVGIPAAPRGVPQIEVSFDIDANGILNVSAKDLGTGKEQSMSISAPNKLDSAEVERMRKQAEEFADTDKKKKEEIETINQADTLVYTAEKQLKDFEGKVSEKEVKGIKDKIDELKKLLAESPRDPVKIKQKLEECNKLLHAAATALYQKASKAKADKPDKSDKSDDVVDAEKA